jgi:hypothetical protein
MIWIDLVSEYLGIIIWVVVSVPEDVVNKDEQFWPVCQCRSLEMEMGVEE